MSKESNHQVLKRARKLLDKESAWTKWTFARDANDAPVDATDPKACKFCLIGALERAAWDMCLPGWVGAVPALTDATAASIPVWNDNPTRTHAEVIAALDKAIGSIT